LTAPSLLATIAERGNGFIDQVKCRSDVEIIEGHGENRERLPEKVVRKIKKSNLESDCDFPTTATT
jgi:hypothetical protein